MYVPPGIDDVPRAGLRTWTALVALLGVGLVWVTTTLLRFLPKLENTPDSRIEHLQDLAQLERALAIAGLVAGLAAHAMAWRKQRRASLVLCGVAGSLFGAAVLLMALTL